MEIVLPLHFAQSRTCRRRALLLKKGENRVLAVL